MRFSWNTTILYLVILLLIFQANEEDVSNFDSEFTQLRAVLTPARDRDPLTDKDQMAFVDFDYSADFSD